MSTTDGVGMGELKMLMFLAGCFGCNWFAGAAAGNSPGVLGAGGGIWRKIL